MYRLKSPDKHFLILTAILVLSGIFVFMLMIASIILPIQGTIQTTHEGNDLGTAAVEWWPMFHHDSTRSGLSGSSAPDTGDVLWTYQTGLSFRHPRPWHDSDLHGMAQQLGTPHFV
jgi:hypothetical protein